MKQKASITAFAALLVFLNVCTAWGQDSSPPPRPRAPRMTSDDVVAAPRPAEPAPSEATTRASAATGLKKYSPEGLGMSIELPGKPIAFSLPGLADAGISPSDAKAYACGGPKLTVIMVRISGGGSSISTQALKGLADGFMTGLAESDGVTDAQSSTRVRDDSTVLVSGTHKEVGRAFETRGVAHSQGGGVYLWVARFPTEDPGAAATAERVINSVEIR